MTLTVQQIAERLQVGQHTVLGWIRRGELRALDVSRVPGGRPRWRVTEAALEEFERARAPVPEVPRVRRRRRKVAAGAEEPWY